MRPERHDSRGDIEAHKEASICSLTSAKVADITEALLQKSRNPEIHQSTGCYDGSAAEVVLPAYNLQANLKV